jgi:predicted  nucleic acid-binding Zn-ribbon protein
MDDATNVQTSEYEDEINKAKQSIVAIEKEIDAFSFLWAYEKNEINDLLESAWGLLENHRKNCAEIQARQEQAIINKEAIWRMRHD